MNRDALVKAMRIGSQSPLEERTAADLGRYGMGLKTASISQARSLTVASRVSANSEINIRRWDLDYIASVDDWRLLKSATSEGVDQVSELEKMSKGTVVLWEKLDRFVGEADASDDKALSQFLDAVRDVEAHICMVFHRYMSGSNSVSFFINGQMLEPWDPFLAGETATQRLPDESLGSLWRPKRCMTIRHPD
jgi:hypothetical protein